VHELPGFTGPAASRVGAWAEACENQSQSITPTSPRCDMSKTSNLPKVQHFILVFDRRADRLVDQINFGSQGMRAVREYEVLERRHQDEPHMDIVLVGSDSIETVMVTHANYFGGLAENKYSDVLRIASA
jgi:hypothetical protein